MLRTRIKPDRDECSLLISGCLQAVDDVTRIASLRAVNDFVQRHGAASLPLLCEGKIFQALTNIFIDSVGGSEETFLEILGVVLRMLEIPGVFAGQVRTSMYQAGLLSTLKDIDGFGLSEHVVEKANAIVLKLQAPISAAASEMQMRSDLDQAQPSMYQPSVVSQPQTAPATLPTPAPAPQGGGEESQYRIASTYDACEPSMYRPQQSRLHPPPLPESSGSDSDSASRTSSPVAPAPLASPLVTLDTADATCDSTEPPMEEGQTAALGGDVNASEEREVPSSLGGLESQPAVQGLSPSAPDAAASPTLEADVVKPSSKASDSVGVVVPVDEPEDMSIDASVDDMTESDLGSLFEKAKASFNAGRHSSAEVKHSVCLRGRRVKFGDTHFDTLESIYELARVKNSLGKYEEALELLKERMKLKARDDIEMSRIASIFLIGIVNHNLGRFSDAIRLHKDCLKMRESRLGVEHPDALSSQFHLAKAYDKSGDAVSAENHFQASLKQQLKVLGEDHVDVLLTKHTFGLFCATHGKPAFAVHLLSSCLSSRTKHGANAAIIEETTRDLETAQESLDSETAVLLSHNSFDQAHARALHTAWKARCDHLGHIHPSGLSVLRALVKLHKQNSDVGSSVEVMSESVAARKEMTLSGEQTSELLDDMTTLASLYTSRKDTSRAISILSDILKRQEEIYQDTDPRLIRTLHEIASAHLEAGNATSAATKAADCVKRLELSSGPDVDATLEALLLHARALYRMGEFSNAAELLEECVGRHRQNTLRARQAVGRGEYPATAVPGNQTGSQIYAESYADALRLLADVYEGSLPGKESRVVPLRKQVLWVSMAVKGPKFVQEARHGLKMSIQKRVRLLNQKAEKALQAAELVSADPDVSLSSVTELMAEYISVFDVEDEQSSAESVPEKASVLFFPPSDGDLARRHGILFKEIAEFDPRGESPAMKSLARLGILSYLCERYNEAEETLSACLELGPNVATAEVVLFAAKTKRALGKAEDECSLGQRWATLVRSHILDADKLVELLQIAKTAASIQNYNAVTEMLGHAIHNNTHSIVSTVYLANGIEYIHALENLGDTTQASELFPRFLRLACSDRDLAETRAELHYHEAMFWQRQGDFDKMKQSLNAGNDCLKERKKKVSAASTTLAPTMLAAQPRSSSVAGGLDDDAFGSTGFIRKLQAATADLAGQLRSTCAQKFTDAMTAYEKQEYESAFKAFYLAYLLQKDEYGVYHHDTARSLHYAACSAWKSYSASIDGAPNMSDFGDPSGCVYDPPGEKFLHDRLNPGSVKTLFEFCIDVRVALDGADNPDTIDSKYQFALMKFELFRPVRQSWLAIIPLAKSLLASYRRRGSEYTLCGSPDRKNDADEVDRRIGTLFDMMFELSKERKEFENETCSIACSRLSKWLEISRRVVGSPPLAFGEESIDVVAARPGSEETPGTQLCSMNGAKAESQHYSDPGPDVVTIDAGGNEINSATTEVEANTKDSGGNEVSRVDDTNSATEVEADTKDAGGSDVSRVNDASATTEVEAAANTPQSRSNDDGHGKTDSDSVQADVTRSAESVISTLVPAGVSVHADDSAANNIDESSKDTFKVGTGDQDFCPDAASNAVSVGDDVAVAALAESTCAVRSAGDKPVETTGSKGDINGSVVPVPPPIESKRPESRSRPAGGRRRSVRKSIASLGDAGVFTRETDQGGGVKTDGKSDEESYSSFSDSEVETSDASPGASRATTPKGNTDTTSTATLQASKDSVETTTAHESSVIDTVTYVSQPNEIKGLVDGIEKPIQLQKASDVATPESAATAHGTETDVSRSAEYPADDDPTTALDASKAETGAGIPGEASPKGDAGSNESCVEPVCEDTTPAAESKNGLTRSGEGSSVSPIAERIAPSSPRPMAASVGSGTIVPHNGVSLPVPAKPEPIRQDPALQHLADALKSYVALFGCDKENRLVSDATEVLRAYMEEHPLKEGLGAIAQQAVSHGDPQACDLLIHSHRTIAVFDDQYYEHLRAKARLLLSKGNLFQYIATLRPLREAGKATMEDLRLLAISYERTGAYQNSCDALNAYFRSHSYEQLGVTLPAVNVCELEAALPQPDDLRDDELLVCVACVLFHLERAEAAAPYLEKYIRGTAYAPTTPVPRLYAKVLWYYFRSGVKEIADFFSEKPFLRLWSWVVNSQTSSNETSGFDRSACLPVFVGDDDSLVPQLKDVLQEHLLKVFRSSLHAATAERKSAETNAGNRSPDSVKDNPPFDLLRVRKKELMLLRLVMPVGATTRIIRGFAEIERDLHSCMEATELLRSCSDRQRDRMRLAEHVLEVWREWTSMDNFLFSPYLKECSCSSEHVSAMLESKAHPLQFDVCDDKTASMLELAFLRGMPIKTFGGYRTLQCAWAQYDIDMSKVMLQEEPNTNSDSNSQPEHVWNFKKGISVYHNFVNYQHSRLQLRLGQSDYSPQKFLNYWLTFEKLLVAENTIELIAKWFDVNSNSTDFSASDVNDYLADFYKTLSSINYGPILYPCLLKLATLVNSFEIPSKSISNVFRNLWNNPEMRPLMISHLTLMSSHCKENKQHNDVMEYVTFVSHMANGVDSLPESDREKFREITESIFSEIDTLRKPIITRMRESASSKDNSNVSRCYSYELTHYDYSQMFDSRFATESMTEATKALVKCGRFSEAVNVMKRFWQQNVTHMKKNAEDSIATCLGEIRVTLCNDFKSAATLEDHMNILCARRQMIGIYHPDTLESLLQVGTLCLNEPDKNNDDTNSCDYPPGGMYFLAWYIELAEQAVKLGTQCEVLQRLWQKHHGDTPWAASLYTSTTKSGDTVVFADGEYYMPKVITMDNELRRNILRVKCQLAVSQITRNMFASGVKALQSYAQEQTKLFGGNDPDVAVTNRAIEEGKRALHGVVASHARDHSGKSLVLLAQWNQIDPGSSELNLKTKLQYQVSLYHWNRQEFGCALPLLESCVKNIGAFSFSNSNEASPFDVRYKYAECLYKTLHIEEALRAYRDCWELLQRSTHISGWSTYVDIIRRYVNFLHALSELTSQCRQNPQCRVM
eukprot:Rmarinus@m.4376